MPSQRNNNLFNPPHPSPWQRFTQNPSLFLATYLYTHQLPISSTSPITPSIKVVCISDTHTLQPRLASGDILIHAGDLTNTGTFAELQAQHDWLNTLPHPHKVVVAGNHDLLLDASYFPQNTNLTNPNANNERRENLDWGSVTYLQHSSTTLSIRGRDIRIYGAPDTPKNGNWAFEYPRANDIWRHTIPEATDILVTHGPSKGHLDTVRDLHRGCVHLLGEIWRVKPRLHVCGHVHDARGIERVDWGCVQWCYDGIQIVRGLGMRRWIVLLAMLILWVLAWLRWVVVGGRRARTTLVNAAVMGKEDLIEGGETIVVEI